jgi:hypothetical protein
MPGGKANLACFFCAAGVGGEIHRGAACLLNSCIYYNIVGIRGDAA